MIYGIGTDIVRIARMAEALARSERFAAKVLGPEELQEFAARRARDPQRGLAYLATRFAAKEALAKALGTGVRGVMTLPAAQILNTPEGKPYLQCDAALGAELQARGLAAQISLSDEAEYAVAYCILTQNAA
ncbi:holo-ACP synthase [Massilia sp. TS11]|uniref:holo-ACP synthase n=1 Tax=Massilia sp. TS11 TaxID=2908003 RepID=UPI001ED9D1A8|nr:holo-ACP synthase [Massilia sp. TS11]MCG2583394.1 holo-ACP synthase [Massilia sp. TS11]